MLSALILSLFALQDPVIREVRSITGPLSRSGCWLPLKVRVAGSSAFEGEVAASSDSGFEVTRPIRLAAGGSVEVLLPVVVLGSGAKVEVRLRGSGGEVDRKILPGQIELLDRERLVLVDKDHPEAEALRSQDLELPDNTPVRFVLSDPADWNEAADLGALESVDAVVVRDQVAIDLSMTLWRTLGGAIVTNPRRDLGNQLREPGGRFESVDARVAGLVRKDPWIHSKRDAAILFFVVYAFGVFVVTFTTWRRGGGGGTLVAGLIGLSILFAGAYAAFFPKGDLAITAWQAVVDAPEGGAAVTLAELRSGRQGPRDVVFGRLVKPVSASPAEASGRLLELRLGEGGSCTVRTAGIPGSLRFVWTERAPRAAPGPTSKIDTEVSEYFKRVARTARQARIVDQPLETGIPLDVKAEGLVEARAIVVLRIDLVR